MSAVRDESAVAFETALRQLQSYRGDPIATIDAACAAEPGFVMGHVLRAEVCITMWERGFLPEVQRGLERLERLAPSATDREQRHIAAIRDWAAGEWEGLRLRLDRLLDDYPTDILALQIGHLADFYHGDRDNLHVRHHRRVFDDPEVRTNQAIMQAVTQHIEQHMAAMGQKPIELMWAIGQEVPPWRMPAPPGAEGTPPGESGPPPDGGPGSPTPPPVERAQPLGGEPPEGGPLMPVNPLDGERAPAGPQ
jgi:hypothetical protein